MTTQMQSPYSISEDLAALALIMPDDMPAWNGSDSYYSITTSDLPLTTDESAASTALAELERKYEAAVAQFLRYSRFRFGWDGYRGQPFDEALIEVAISILEQARRFLEANRIVPDELEPGPASDGSVDLEIATPEWRLILTIYSNEPTASLYTEKAGRTTTEVIDLSSTSLVGHLSRLAS